MDTIINENSESIKEIFNTVKIIAIVGLSPKEDKASNMVAKYIQNQGYKIIPIYPKEQTILGEKVYRSLAEVEQRVDMVVMFRKALFADEVVDTIRKRDDIKVLWLQKEIVNNSAAKIAKDLGLKVIQDKCAMVEHRNVSN